MPEKSSRKYREKNKFYLCKKKFNSDYNSKHRETIHKGLNFIIQQHFGWLEPANPEILRSNKIWE